MPLCYPMDCNPPGSSVHGIPQARILEWAAVPFPRDLPIPGIKPVSCVSCSGRRVLCPLHHLGSPMVYYRLWTITPGAVQEELLFIHSVCNGLCLHIHTQPLTPSAFLSGTCETEIHRYIYTHTHLSRIEWWFWLQFNLASLPRQELVFLQPFFSTAHAHVSVCLLTQQFCFSINAVLSVCGPGLAEVVGFSMVTPL